MLRKLLSPWLVVVPVWVSAQAAAEERGMSNERPAIHKSEKFGLNFYYAGDQSVKEFLNTTPCVSGVSWRFHKEDDEHYIGELHYPTENTGNYDAENPRARSPMYYMVTGLKIRKQKDLPLDLKTYRGTLVLRDPSPQTPLAVRGDDTAYELVGFQKNEKPDGKSGFLFSQHEDLKYIPPEE